MCMCEPMRSTTVNNLRKQESRKAKVQMASTALFQREAFAGAAFDAAAWVNAALRAEGEGSDEPLELRISVLVTKMQLAAADIDADVQRHEKALLAAARSVSRDVALAREQTSAVRTELGALVEDVSALEARSESAVGELRGRRGARPPAGAKQSLQQAARVKELLRAAESAAARGDAAAAAASIGHLGDALDAAEHARRPARRPGQGGDPAAAGRRSTASKPELLQAVREHDAAAMGRLAGLYAGLGAAPTVRDTYVQCAQGPLFERWNEARRLPTAAAALEALWGCVSGRGARGAAVGGAGVPGGGAPPRDRRRRARGHRPTGHRGDQHGASAAAGERRERRERRRERRCGEGEGEGGEAAGGWTARGRARAPPSRRCPRCGPTRSRARRRSRTPWAARGERRPARHRRRPLTL